MGLVPGNNKRNLYEIKPLFFNFHSLYRTSEISIDGAISAKNTLTLKIKKGSKGEEELPSFSKTVPKNILFSIFFPVWLGKNLHSIKLNIPKTFQTILEDGAEPSFNPVSGWVRLEKNKKITVHYRDNLSTWTIDEKGMPLSIEMPAQKTTVQKVTEKIAKEFLTE